LGEIYNPAYLVISLLYANNAGMPPVLVETIVSAHLNRPFLIESMNPAIALPVYNGSRNKPAVRLTNLMASADSPNYYAITLAQIVI